MFVRSSRPSPFCTPPSTPNGFAPSLGSFISSRCPPPAWIASFGQQNRENIPQTACPWLWWGLLGVPAGCQPPAASLPAAGDLLPSSGRVPRIWGEMLQRMYNLFCFFSPSARFSQKHLKFCETFFSLFMTDALVAQRDGREGEPCVISHPNSATDRGNPHFCCSKNTNQIWRSQNRAVPADPDEENPLPGRFALPVPNTHGPNNCRGSTDPSAPSFLPSITQ